jgi:hypothetical protein
VFRVIVVIALAVTVASACDAQETSPQGQRLLLTGLSLDLRVDYAERSLQGSATLRVRNLADRPARNVSLLLNRLMTASRVVDGQGSNLPFIQRVAVFDDDPSRQVTQIVVTPGRLIAPRDSVTLTVTYGGILTGYTETGSLYIRDHVSPEFTIIREDAYAFPVLGVLSSRANRSSPREPFSFSARVSVPTGLVVAMGGSRGERLDQDSIVTWRYHSAAPVPFLNITIAPYRVAETSGARIFHFAADSMGATVLRDAVAGALSQFGKWYGPLSSLPDLAVMEIPEGFGSQASLTAGMILTADAFRDRAQLRQLYHELSHLWNPPDNDRPSPRWNEGLATFLQWRMASELDGWKDWETRTNSSVQTLLRRCPQLACDSIAFIDYGKAGRTDMSYSVGFLMFYTLHELLGADAFDRVYRGFFQRYREQGVTTAELAAAFREADARSDRVLSDWLLTTRWYARLSAGETLVQMIETYRQ